MANNYSRFSEQIENLTKNEYAWLVSVLAVDPYGLEKEELRKFLDDVGLTEDDLEWGWPFDHKFENEGHSLWIYSEESFNPEALGAFLTTFMARFNREGHMSITWADTCTKPRIGEFGGGIIVVTKDGYAIEHTSSLTQYVLGQITKE